MCGEAYGKVPIAWCDNLRLVGPRKNALGKEKRLRKGNVMMWSIGHERSPTWYWTDGAMGIGYSRW